MFSRGRVVATSVALLIGCAEDGTAVDVKVAEVEPGSRTGCPNGGLRVTVDDEDHYVCNGADGADGEDGERGAAGAAGKDGAMGTAGRDGAPGMNGAAWTPQTITACVSLTRLPSSGINANLTYTLVRFSDGSVFVSCSASTNASVGAAGSTIFAGWQQGAAGGACILASDASGAPTGGWWKFEVLNGQPTATYHDVGTADDLSKFTFPTSDCPTASK